MFFLIVVFLLFLLILKTHVVTQTNQTIPKTIVLTTRDKNAIPNHIHEQYKKHAKGYQLLIFDDADCEAFLKTEYPPEVLRTFRRCKVGAHKADLFRYAYLFKRGGVYLDVKTVLLKDLDTFIRHDTPVFYVVFTDDKRLYNGILCTPPRNEYFYKLLSDMVYGPPLTYYMQVCESAASILKKDYGMRLTKGFHETPKSVPDVVLWKEVFCNAEKHCNKKKDRYGFCNFCIDQHDTKLFKIRDENYGKNWK